MLICCVARTLPKSAKKMETTVIASSPAEHCDGAIDWALEQGAVERDMSDESTYQGLVQALGLRPLEARRLSPPFCVEVSKAKRRRTSSEPVAGVPSPVARSSTQPSAAPSLLGGTATRQPFVKIEPGSEFRPRHQKTNMPPKHAAHSDHDHDDRVDPESLDNKHWKSAQGGFLTTLHGNVEEKLPQAIKLERLRERTKLLQSCVLPDTVRRMCRRAGVSMHQKTAPDDEDSVSQTLQKVCDLYLFNLCKEINRLSGYFRKKTLTEDIVREALKSFHLKLFGSCEERHAICRTMKHHRNETGDEDWRGAEAEIYHERITNAGPCLYLSHAPFLRLVRLYLAEQASFEHPLIASAGVISGIQLSMETILIDLLEKARYMVRQTTQKKASDSSPRNTVVGRDLKTVLVVLAARHPILRGRLRALGDPALPRRRSSSRGAPRGSAHAKAKAKAKGGAPARAKASALATKR